MTISNRFSFAQLRDYIKDCESNKKPQTITPSQAIDLQDELSERKTALKVDEALLESIMATVYGGMAAERYQAEKKDTGKVVLPVGDEFELEADRKKKVEWDQKKLAELWTRIDADPASDPGVYMAREVEFKIKEVAFEGWPDAIKAEFKPARTVKAGETKFTMKPKKKGK